MAIKDIKDRFWRFLEDYWWLLLIVIGLGYFFTDILIFRYIFYAIGIIFALFLFLPTIIQFFAPAYFLITSLIEHFKSGENLSFGKKYIFIPSALLAATAFIAAQFVLSAWVLVLTITTWGAVMGFFLTFLLLFFFGLMPVAIFTAPFVVWYYAGFIEFLGIALFFLLTLFWFSFSRIAYPEDYRTTIEDFLGHSPQMYLLGALAFQIIALPFYKFGVSFESDKLLLAGDWVVILGEFFIIIAFASWISWLKFKKKLKIEEREVLYKAPIWIYILGFFATNILYVEFAYNYQAPVFSLFWLNAIFLIAIISRFFGFIKNRFIKKAHYAEIS